VNPFIWASGALGLVAILLGLSMLTNLNGSATAMSKYLKESKPMGVDYSGSFLASPAYARFFGGFFAFVGGMFVFTSLNSSEMWGSSRDRDAPTSTLSLRPETAAALDSMPQNGIT
jgi:hypothetical protein